MLAGIITGSEAFAIGVMLAGAVELIDWLAFALTVLAAQKKDRCQIRRRGRAQRVAAVLLGTSNSLRFALGTGP